jgi:hypothetical protein
MNFCSGNNIKKAMELASPAAPRIQNLMFIEFGTQESHTAQLQLFFTQSNLFFVCIAKLLGTFTSNITTSDNTHGMKQPSKHIGQSQ